MRRCAALPVRAHLPQLFHTAPCQASIRLLRWPARPLPGPRCQSPHSGPWGTDPYRPGGTRSGGQSGTRPCNALTAPRRHWPKRPLPDWLRAPFLWCLACALRGIPRERGLHGRPSARGGGWLRHAALSSERPRPLAGPVAAEAREHPAGHQGPAQPGGKKSLGRRARGRRQPREPGWGRSKPALSALRRGPAASRRPAMARSRRCSRRPGSPGARAGGSPRPRPAAPGRGRGPGPRASSSRRKQPRAGRSTSSGRRGWAPCASPLCGCAVAAARTPCRGLSASCRPSGTRVSSTPANRQS